MSIQRITFEQQLAQVGSRSRPARLNISMPESQINIQDVKPQLEVDTQIPTFRSPRQRISNESGLMSPLTFAKKFRDEGRQGALRAAGSYKNDGNFIANHRIPGDKSIPLLAKNKMNQLLGPKNVNIGLMPTSIPSLDWDKGYININFSRHNIRVDWSGRNTAQISADINYPVEVFLSRRPSFRVTGVEQNITKNTIGRFIDRSV